MGFLRALNKGAGLAEPAYVKRVHGSGCRHVQERAFIEMPCPFFHRIIRIRHGNRERHSLTANADQEHRLELQSLDSVHVSQADAGDLAIIGGIAAYGVGLQVIAVKCSANTLDIVSESISNFRVPLTPL